MDDLAFVTGRKSRATIFAFGGDSSTFRLFLGVDYIAGIKENSSRRGEVRVFLCGGGFRLQEKQLHGSTRSHFFGVAEVVSRSIKGIPRRRNCTSNRYIFSGSLLPLADDFVPTKEWREQAKEEQPFLDANEAICEAMQRCMT